MSRACGRVAVADAASIAVDRDGGRGRFRRAAGARDHAAGNAARTVACMLGARHGVRGGQGAAPARGWRACGGARCGRPLLVTARACGGRCVSLPVGEPHYARGARVHRGAALRETPGHHGHHTGHARAHAEPWQRGHRRGWARHAEHGRCCRSCGKRRRRGRGGGGAGQQRAHARAWATWRARGAARRGDEFL